MAPRKVRLVLGLIRGKSALDAETLLSFTHRAASLPVLKLLRSAMANAEHNFKLDKSTLYVKTATADGGPTLKRTFPRAMGRGAIIRKRTSHVTIILSDEQPRIKTALKKKDESATSTKAPVARKPRAAKAAKTSNA